MADPAGRPPGEGKRPPEDEPRRDRAPQQQPDDGQRPNDKVGDGQPPKDQQQPDDGAQPKDQQPGDQQPEDKAKAAAQSVPDYSRLRRQHGVVFGEGAVILGDVVLGDKRESGKERGRRHPSPTEVNVDGVLNAVYLPPPNWDRARDELGRRRVVVLSGPARVGKWTAAVQLLASKPGRPIYQIDSLMTAAQLARLSFQDEAGYIVHRLAPAGDGLDARLLERLEQTLHRHRSFMVVTVDGASPTLSGAIPDHHVDWSQPPDASLLLAELLDDRLFGDPPAAALVATWLEDERFQEAVDEVAVIGESSRVVELAELLANGARQGLAPEAVLQLRETAVLAEIGMTFTGRDLRRQSLMLALAVLGGMSRSVVMTAAGRLYEHAWQAIEAQRPEGPVRARRLKAKQVHASSLTSVELWQSTRIRDVGARPLRGVEERAFGRSSVWTLGLPSDRYQERVLRHVWEEHDILHRPLLAWLGDLVNDHRPTVQDAAAVAVGRLCVVDLLHLYDLVLADWAESDQFSERSAAAIALTVATAEDVDLALQILGLLDHWSEPDSQARWTAAVAWGLVGPRAPDAALRCLRHIAADPTLRWVVARSVSNLFAAADWYPELHGQVLQALLDWTAAEDRKQRAAAAAGHRAVLQVLLDSVDGQGRPGLRRLLDEEQPEDPFTVLWRRVLQQRSTRREALDRLRDVVVLGDEDDGLRPAVHALLRRMAAGSDWDERDRILYHLDKWANSPTEPSALAAESLASLRREGANGRHL